MGDRRASSLNADAVRRPDRRELGPATDEVIPICAERVRGGEVPHGLRRVAIRIDRHRDEGHAARIGLQLRLRGAETRGGERADIRAGRVQERQRDDLTALAREGHRATCDAIGQREVGSVGRSEVRPRKLRCRARHAQESRDPDESNEISHRAHDMSHHRAGMPPLRVVAGYASVALIWGSTWAAIKIGVNDVPPFVVAGDRLSVLKVFGLVLGLGGTVILIGAPDTADGAAGLIAAVVLALMPITWAIAAILQSRFLRTVAPIPTVALGTWASVLLLAPLASLQLSLGQHWTTASVLAFAYLVVFGTCFGMVVSLWLYRKLRPTTITLIQVLVPAEAILIGTLWLGEPVTIRMLGGAALVVAAVALNAIAGGGTPSAEERLAATPAAAE